MHRGSYTLALTVGVGALAVGIYIILLLLR